MVAASASIVHADEHYNPSCGQNVPYYAHAYSISHSSNPSTWLLSWRQDCSYQGTVEVELQQYTSGSWVDLGAFNDQLFTTPQSDAKRDMFRETIINNGPPCSNSVDYRIQVFDANGASGQTMGLRHCN